jgi:hypothetical protein
VEIVCGGVEDGNRGRFGGGRRLLFALGRLLFASRSGLGGERSRLLLHDAFDEFGYCAFSLCRLRDFGAWGEDA